jgi:hypothetical protein
MGGRVPAVHLDHSGPRSYLHGFLVDHFFSHRYLDPPHSIEPSLPPSPRTQETRKDAEHWLDGAT